MRMTLRHYMYVCSTRRKSRRCPGKSFLVRSLVARRMTLSWFQHSIGAPTCHNVPRFAIIYEKSWPEVGNRWRWSRFFLEKRPLKGKFSTNVSERIHRVTEPCFVCKFCENWLTGNRQSRALFTWQKNKTSARSPDARIAPKICHSQLQTIYSEFSKFHPSPFTSGRVIAERVNIVETRHKVFPILGEASSPSNNIL